MFHQTLILSTMELICILIVVIELLKVSEFIVYEKRAAYL